MDQLLGLVSIFIGIHLLTKKDATVKEQFGGGKPDFVLFHQPWCGWCVKFMPIWNEFDNSKINKVTVNCKDQEDVCKQNGIESYPTVRYYPNGMNDSDNYEKYEGERTIEALNNFINNK